MIILIFFLFSNKKNIYAEGIKTIEEKENKIFNVIHLLDIIDDTNNLDQNLTRAEFAKIIVKSSKNKNKIADYNNVSVSNDVSIDNKYAAYIKEVLTNSYMFSYIDGSFKPDSFVTYSDLSRAMLKMLGYTNEDFDGNKTKSMNLKFKSLELDKGIKKGFDDILTKKDIMLGIYNTLKHKVKTGDNIYGLLVFDKLIIDSDGELNADEYIERKLIGPIFANTIDEIENNNYLHYIVYINGIKLSFKELKYDIEDYGYAIIYIDDDNEVLYGYTEREDITSPVRVLKGYISGIYYNAENISTPYRVDIGLQKYYIENEDMKFAFSQLGSFKENDYIVYLSNKMNDVSKAYINENGKRVSKNEDIELYDGSIINAFKYEIIKSK